MAGLKEAFDEVGSAISSIGTSVRQIETERSVEKASSFIDTILGGLGSLFS
jgi:hypothetical protein